LRVEYEIEVAEQPRRPIAAVAEDTTWDRFADQWRGMLDEVYACLRHGGVHGDCNVMLYRDLPDPGQVRVEVGVEVNEPFSPSGRVSASALPAGLTAMTVHRGPYERLDAGHRAVLRWCASQGRELTGERWEVYGDWHDDPSLLETRIYYALRGGSYELG
jgi:effector-binding domain-containing protein